MFNVDALLYDTGMVVNIWFQPLPPRSYKPTSQRPVASQTQGSSSEDSSSGNQSPLLPTRYSWTVLPFPSCSISMRFCVASSLAVSLDSCIVSIWAVKPVVQYCFYKAELSLCLILNKTKLVSVVMCCTCDLIDSYVVGIWDVAFG